MKTDMADSKGKQTMGWLTKATYNKQGQNVYTVVNGLSRSISYINLKHARKIFKKILTKIKSP